MSIRTAMLLGITLLILVACNNSVDGPNRNQTSENTGSSCVSPLEVNRVFDDPLKIINQPLSLVDIGQTNPELVEATQQTIDYLQGDWNAWLLELYIEPDLPFEVDYFVMNP